jgi:GDP-mannose 6-dehydrogenase
MNIGVFGLGYVGTVCAACLARLGHHVVGIDSNPTKVELMAQGKPPIIEKDVAEYVSEAVDSGRLHATTSARRAVAETELSLICVGTPSRANGSLDTSAVETVSQQIGLAIGEKNEYHSVVVRSTVLPGTVRGSVLPILEGVTGGRVGERFGLASNPEFMREGSAIADFYDPPKTVIGEIDSETADKLAMLYHGLPGPLFRTQLEIAEMVKYVDNVWHGLKITFGNEVGAICKKAAIDSHALMDIFCADRKLNISAAYLKPGFAFGGSCLPKDTRALTYFSHAHDLEVPVLSSVMRSNREQIDRGVEWILGTGAKRIAMLGLSFKAGTDDLRESPFLEIIERLIGKGRSIRIFDKNVDLARLVGANRAYLYGTIPHIADLLVGSVEEAVDDAEVVVVTTNSQEYRSVVDLLGPDQKLLDFARLKDAEKLGERYDGLLW